MPPLRLIVNALIGRWLEEQRAFDCHLDLVDALSDTLVYMLPDAVICSKARSISTIEVIASECIRLVDCVALRELLGKALTT